jgi:hypothetical protein
LDAGQRVQDQPEGGGDGFADDEADEEGAELPVDPRAQEAIDEGDDEAPK